LIGRSKVSSLQVSEVYVSAQHATIRWTGEHWELKDLGSRNGTFLNGAPLLVGAPSTLRPGDVIGLGSPDEAWEVENADPPQPMIVPAVGDPVVIDGAVQAIPSPDNPVVTLYRAPDGEWKLERPDEGVVGLCDEATFEVDGTTWQFFCPAVFAATRTSEHGVRVEKIRLAFSVSRDEEHVELEAQRGAERLSLGSRAHNYLLLTLARHRLDDLQAGFPETSCGWVYQDDLIKSLSISSGQLNIDIFRIRKLFSSHGLAAALDVVERRPRTKQVRIGAGDITISNL
jgi:hypothetical protein